MARNQPSESGFYAPPDLEDRKEFDYWLFDVHGGEKQRYGVLVLQNVIPPDATSPGETYHRGVICVKIHGTDHFTQVDPEITGMGSLDQLLSVSKLTSPNFVVALEGFQQMIANAKPYGS